MMVVPESVLVPEMVLAGLLAPLEPLGAPARECVSEIEGVCVRERECVRER